MGILEKFMVRAKLQSLHPEAGTTSALDQSSVDRLLAESCRCLLEKDLAALDRLFAIGAKFSVVVRESGAPSRSKGGRVVLQRADYLAYASAEFERHTLMSYRLTIDKILRKSDDEWKLSCTSEAVLSDGLPQPKSHELVTIEIANGHPVVTELGIEKYI